MEQAGSALAEHTATIQDRFAATAGDAVVALAVQGERVNETLSDGFKAFEGAVVDQGKEVARTLAARGDHIARELADHLHLF